ncbi:MAG: phosphate/phosphite/phosphonate ABC transporter substrate-binding protein [Vicinamibacterales bacterium]
MRRILTLLGLAPLWWWGCAAAGPTAGDSERLRREGWPSELVFAIGVNPEDSDAVLQHAPFISRIQEATGLPVRLFSGTSFSSVVEAMRARRVDGMQTGVFSYLLAEKEAGAEAVAVYITATSRPPTFDPTLRPEYAGLIVVRKGSGIRTLDDLRGRTLSFGDPAGTSDHLVPKTELINAGINPDRDLKSRFAGNHAAAILSVWHGTADAAATADAAMRRFAESLQVPFCDFPPDEIGRAHTPADVRAVYERCPDGHLAMIHAAPIPGTPFALRGDLPADLKAAIRESLLATTGDPAFIQAAGRWYVDPSESGRVRDIFAYYDGMRDLARLLDLDLRRSAP